jgi:hypothetical protein
MPKARRIRLNGTTLYAHGARSYRRIVAGEAAGSERYAFALRGGVITAVTFGYRGPSGSPAGASIARRD